MNVSQVIYYKIGSVFTSISKTVSLALGGVPIKIGLSVWSVRM